MKQEQRFGELAKIYSRRARLRECRLAALQVTVEWCEGETFLAEMEVNVTKALEGLLRRRTRT